MYVINIYTGENMQKAQFYGISQMDINMEIMRELIYRWWCFVYVFLFITILGLLKVIAFLISGCPHVIYFICIPGLQFLSVIKRLEYHILSVNYLKITTIQYFYAYVAYTVALEINDDSGSMIL